jgi:hypothetical protein
MNRWLILCLLCSSTLFCRATPEEDIRDYYQKLNFVALLSTDDERAKIEARQGASPLYAADPRLSLVEKYLDNLGSISVDPRSRDIRKDDVSRWKNPTLRTWALFVYKIVSVEKRGESYFVRLQSLTSDDVYDQASQKGFLKKVPDLSEVPSLISQLGNWDDLVITELDEWKPNGESWQAWRVASSMTVKGKGEEIKIPE